MEKIWPILNGNLTQKVPILNDQADMRPILNGNLSIHSIHLKPKKNPFPSELCSHIPSRMNPSQTPGVNLPTYSEGTVSQIFNLGLYFMPKSGNILLNL